MKDNNYQFKIRGNSKCKMQNAKFKIGCAMEGRGEGFCYAKEMS